MATVDRTHLEPSPRQIQIVQLIADGSSLGDIARELGVTESRISQIHTQALRQMRAMLAE